VLSFLVVVALSFGIGVYCGGLFWFLLLTRATRYLMRRNAQLRATRLRLGREIREIERAASVPARDRAAGAGPTLPLWLLPQAAPSPPGKRP